MGRVHAAAAVINLVQQLPLAVEHKDGVVSGDQLVVAVAVQIRDHRRGVPAGFAVEIHHKYRLLDFAGALAGGADHIAHPARGVAGDRRASASTGVPAAAP